MTPKDSRYEMTLSLNVLRHLGLGLYSNISAVLAEAVANAWDADAEEVRISLEDNKVIIQDDGHGMTVADANRKYLRVGYERRKTENQTPRFRRSVMGRKGIGKLSLFSIAHTVEVHSARKGEKHGFIMDAKEIEANIGDDGEAKYHPRPVSPSAIDLDCGTCIILTHMKRKLQWTGNPLRRRLARRFSIIGADNFRIKLDGHTITIADREYQDKCQYIWTYGPLGVKSCAAAKNVKHKEKRAGEIEIDGSLNLDPDLAIDGWIGTAFNAGQLRDADTSESLNKIVVMVRGKLAQEDILEEFGEGGLYTKYIFGEIHANFLDLDDQEDIATTSRQSLIEEDPRYQALKAKLGTELKYIQREWTNLRNQQGEEQAFSFPQIKEWFSTLDADQQKAATRLFGRINQLPLDDLKQKRPLFISGVLAFESLKLRSLLHRLDEISPENLETLHQVFIQLDDLEASAYYQIAKDRLEVIRKLTNLVDGNAKEKALQEHLYKHLWLLDPSWERATHTEYMERRISTALQDVCNSLPKEHQAARLDIYYSTTGNKHVIIELKRADRVLRATDLLEQISRYYDAAENILINTNRGNEPLEIVCIVGRRLRDWENSPKREERDREALQAFNARVVLYDELIDNALQAYEDYITRREEVGKVYQLIRDVSEQDVQDLSPTSG